MAEEEVSGGSRAPLVVAAVVLGAVVVIAWVSMRSTDAPETALTGASVVADEPGTDEPVADDPVTDEPVAEPEAPPVPPLELREIQSWVLHGPGGFLGLGAEDVGVAHSPAGEVWTLIQIVTGLSELRGAATTHTDDLWYLIGTDTVNLDLVSFASPDGTSWTPAEVPVPDTNLRGLVASGDRFLLATAADGADEAEWWVSDDGLEWLAVDGIANDELAALAGGSSGFMAAYWDGGSETLSTRFSVDGLAWEEPIVAAGRSRVSIAEVDGRWVMVVSSRAADADGATAWTFESGTWSEIEWPFAEAPAGATTLHAEGDRLYAWVRTTGLRPEPDGTFVYETLDGVTWTLVGRTLGGVVRLAVSPAEPRLGLFSLTTPSGPESAFSVVTTTVPPPSEDDVAAALDAFVMCLSEEGVEVERVEIRSPSRADVIVSPDLSPLTRSRVVDTCFDQTLVSLGDFRVQLVPGSDPDETTDTTASDTTDTTAP